MSGNTEIDAASVSSAGTEFSEVGGQIGEQSVTLLSDPLAPLSYGWHYQAEGAEVTAAITKLAEATNQWSRGATSIGTGLTTSAANHTTTESNNTDSISESGND